MPDAWPVQLDDFRVVYLQEARKCLIAHGKCKIDQPEFWANLLGGLLNATIASVPNSVAVGLLESQANQKALHKHILDKLDARS